MNDPVIRQALLDLFVGPAREHGHTRIIEELGIQQGAVRADLALIGKKQMTGIEIKSPKDTLERLARQVPLYNAIFDRCYLVVAKKHLEKSLPVVPPWWGVIVVEPGVAIPDEVTGEVHTGVRLLPFRRASDNPAPSAYTRALLLWRDEAYAEVQRAGIGAGHSRSTRHTLCKLLAKSLSEEVLLERVCERLRERKGWRSDL